ncbi:MAG: DUF1566 domain-containing protein [Deltaproteobacteria bacterium]|nr:DUF1566 domain-containing protein [Deltaproteobacteria bacterium]
MRNHWWRLCVVAGVLILGACAAPPPAKVEKAGQPAPVEVLSERYTVLPEGVIADARTGLQWVVGPDRDMDFDQAVAWVGSCRAAGGGWRMPTREELRSLHQPGRGERNMAPVFQTSGWWVWAEPRDARSAWSFSFNHGCATWDARINSCYGRAFGVRQALR